jgi:type IX secretion system PorP/SprF family membrane protein
MKTYNINKILCVLTIIFSVSWAMHGQSRYFDERYIYTQAQLNPQLINPGAIGSALKHQILVNYRNKWSGIDGAPHTLTLSYNGPAGNRLGIGVNVLSDKFGSLETTKGAVGVSYMIKSTTNQVGFGISGEYIKHALSNLGNADPGDPLFPKALQGAEFFDASFGLYGIYMDKLSYGIALPSVVSARISDIDSVSANRVTGFILQCAYKLDIQEDITMTPGVIVKRLANVPTHIDLNLNFGFLQDKLLGGVSYTIGADKRLGFLIGTKIEKLNLYYSYNTSSHLIQDYNNGSHELTLGFNFGGK